VVYCHCREPVNVKAQRYCALAPLATIGPVTILATLIYPALWLALVTSVHIAGCIGDVWIFLRMRRFAADCFYVDSPDKIGGAVFEPLPKPSLAVNPGAAL
jgi:hypothetical protein